MGAVAEAATEEKAEQIGYELPQRAPRVSWRQLVVFTSQMSLMLESGTPIADALDALTKQLHDTPLGTVVAEVAADVSGGSSLTEAVSRHPGVFSRTFVSAVRAGEASGRLGEILRSLEVKMRKDVKLRASVRAAMIYPSILAGLVIMVAVLMVAFVLPRFAKVFQAAGVLLPLPTRVLLGLAAFVTDYWYLLIIGLGATGFGMATLLRSESARGALQRWLVNSPLLGGVARGTQVSALARTIGMSLEAGVPLLECISVAAQACGLKPFRELMGEVEQSVLRGQGFAFAFQESELVTPAFKQIVTTGERTGSLTMVLTRVADQEDEEIERNLKQVLAAAEPAMVVAVGGVVGAVAFSVLLPLFDLAKAVKIGGG